MVWCHLLCEYEGREKTITFSSFHRRCQCVELSIIILRFRCYILDAKDIFPFLFGQMVGKISREKSATYKLKIRKYWSAKTEQKTSSFYIKHIQFPHSRNWSLSCVYYCLPWLFRMGGISYILTSIHPFTICTLCKALNI